MSTFITSAQADVGFLLGAFALGIQQAFDIAAQKMVGVRATRPVGQSGNKPSSPKLLLTPMLQDVLAEKSHMVDTHLDQMREVRRGRKVL